MATVAAMPRPLVELARVGPQVRVVHDAAAVAAEVQVVDGVEAHERGEQAPVGLGDPVAGEVAARAEQLLEVGERLEQLVDGLVVGLLGAGEPGAVDAVVDGRVDALVDAVDLVAQRGGVEVGLRVGSARYSNPLIAFV
jgi:hypothetical protein